MFVCMLGLTCVTQRIYYVFPFIVIWMYVVCLLFVKFICPSNYGYV